MNTEILIATLRDLVPKGDGYNSEYANTLSEAANRLEALQFLAGEAYVFAGVYDAPANVLDSLLAAANGEPGPYKSFLPVASPK